MRFLDYSCFKPAQHNFQQTKSQCTWCPIFGESPQPSQRSNHAVCVYENQIFMYGGRGVNGTLNQFWVYSCDNQKWKELFPSGDAPPRLEGHSMVVYDGNIYIFGGETSFASADELPLWQFNIERCKWTKIGPNGKVMAPCGRRHHTAVLYMDVMCVYGGYQDLIGPTKELWLFDFETSSWHFDVAASCESAPDARYGHCAAVNNQSMWICGGLTGLKPNSEVFVWNFELMIWISVKTKGGPSELSGHAMSMVNNSLYVFGGCNNLGESSNDMWRLTLSDSAWKKCHPDDAVKPPAVSGHRLVRFCSASMLKKTELRTRSFPDIKRKRSASRVTLPAQQRSVSCGKLPNSSKGSESLDCEGQRTASDKRKLIKEDAKTEYAYDNPAISMSDVEVSPPVKFEPIQAWTSQSPEASTGVKSLKTPPSGDKLAQSRYVTSRMKRGHLTAPGNNLSTFSYNLLQDSLNYRSQPNVFETSFIEVPSSGVPSKVSHSQENATAAGDEPMGNFPKITTVKPLSENVLQRNDPEWDDVEMESLSQCDDGETGAETATSDIANYTGITPQNASVTRFFEASGDRESSEHFSFLILGGKMADVNPNINKPFCVWQCNISP